MPAKYRYMILWAALFGVILISVTSQIISRNGLPVMKIRPFWSSQTSYEDKTISKNILIEMSEEESKAEADKLNKANSNSLKEDLIPSRIWLLGAAFFLFRISIGLYGVHKIHRQSIEEAADKRHQDILRELKKRSNIKQNVELIESRIVLSPFSTYFMKPCIYLPASSSFWTEEQLRMILVHELAHIKRSDYVFNLLQSILCALFWFNPLIWIMSGYLKEERETACDDMVVAYGFKSYVYAECLFKMMQTNTRNGRLALAANKLTGNSKNETRIINILDSTRKRPPKREVFVSLILILLCTSVYSSFINLDNKNSAGVFDEEKKFEINYKYNLININLRDMGIVIKDVKPRDLPTYWPIGENEYGQVHSNVYNNVRWTTIENSNYISNLPIYAAADGIVQEVRRISSDKAYRIITVQHKNNFLTTYVNITNASVQPGDKIKKGSLIGISNCNDVYYYLQYGRKPLDPVPFMLLDHSISKL